MAIYKACVTIEHWCNVLVEAESEEAARDIINEVRTDKLLEFEADGAFDVLMIGEVKDPSPIQRGDALSAADLEE